MSWSAVSGPLVRVGLVGVLLLVAEGGARGAVPEEVAEDRLVSYLPLALLNGQPAELVPPPQASPSPSPPTATPEPAKPTPTPSPPAVGHHPGEDCLSCHPGLKVGGTVFADETAQAVAPGVGLVLIRPDGSELVLDASDRQGNIAAALVPDGTYLVRLGQIGSRTWHRIPDQSSCNTCHLPGGNGSATRTKRFPDRHTQIPADNNCTHCHYFPASMSWEELMTPGVLNAAVRPPEPPGSQVEILGQVYPFDPAEYDIQTVRPDIFAPGHFSMFDAILAVARKHGIDISYEFDQGRQTHFISRINGVPGDYWYHFSYDTGSRRGNQTEIAYRRANRWDETLWRPGVWVKVVEGEDLAAIKREYLEEIQRERRSGHLIPLVQISINPSPYRGNPSGSGRITVRREFRNVQVTAHDWRATGFPSPYSKPFQPGVVTSLDIPLSLMDQGRLDAVTGVFYTHFAGNYIDSYYIVELGFPGIGRAHASGRQGFVYITENGPNGRPVNQADRKFHITADISVIHAPDFSIWRWIELGNPYYEPQEPTDVDPLLLEDSQAIDRGFNLHPPEVDATGTVHLRFNVFEPGRVRLTVENELGEPVAFLFDDQVANIGIHELSWQAGGRRGLYYVRMQFGQHTQIRQVAVGE